MLGIVCGRCGGSVTEGVMQVGGLLVHGRELCTLGDIRMTAGAPYDCSVK